MACVCGAAAGLGLSAGFSAFGFTAALLVAGFAAAGFAAVFGFSAAGLSPDGFEAVFAPMAVISIWVSFARWPVWRR